MQDRIHLHISLAQLVKYRKRKAPDKCATVRFVNRRVEARTSLDSLEACFYASEKFISQPCPLSIVPGKSGRDVLCRFRE